MKCNLGAILPQNIQAVLDLEKLCFPEGEAWTAEEFLDVSFPNLVYTLEDADTGQRLGHVGIEVRENNTLYISNIAVEPSFRRRGVASWFIARFLASYDKIILEVRPSNISAIKFYEKHGFKDVGRNPGQYVNPPEDGIIMEWNRE